MTSASEGLTRKVKVRAGHRASTTRLIAQAEAALTAESLNPADLELAVTNLDRKVGVLTPLDAKILELTPDDDIEAEIDHADQYQEDIQRMLSKLNKALLAASAPIRKTILHPAVEMRRHQPYGPWDCPLQLILQREELHLPMVPR